MTKLNEYDASKLPFDFHRLRFAAGFAWDFSFRSFSPSSPTHDNDDIKSAMPMTTLGGGGEATLPPPTPLTRSSSTLRRRRRRILKRRPPKLTWQSASFQFSLYTTYLVIAFLWSIVPAAFLYVLYTVLTSFIPALEPYRPDSTKHTSLKVLHYIFLGYCALEIPFTGLYRWLAWRQQGLRSPLRHSRKHLRGLILRSLENGLTLEEEFEKEAQDETRGEGEGLERTSRDASSSPELQKVEETWVETSKKAGTSKVEPAEKGRKRSNRLRGDGAATPELSTMDLANDYLSARQLPTLRTDDPPQQAPLGPSTSRSTLGSPVDEDEGFAGSRASLDSAFASNSSPRKNTSTSYPPPRARSQDKNKTKRDHAVHHGAPVSGFIDPPLSPTDPRAIDFRDYLRYWFSGCQFNEIKKLNMADWLAWSLYGSTLETLEEERKKWDKDGRPPMKLDDGTLDDDDSDDFDEDTAIEGDKYGLVMHCVEMVEARAAHRFEEGRNEEIKTLRLTLDPVRVTQRPLILYLVVALLQNGVLAATKIKGFKEIKDGKVK